MSDINEDETDIEYMQEIRRLEDELSERDKQLQKANERIAWLESTHEVLNDHVAELLSTQAGCVMVPQWIALSENIPETELALAWNFSDNGTHEIVRHIKTWLFDGENVFIGRVNHGSMTVKGYESEDSIIVTHWMPYTEPEKPLFLSAKPKEGRV